MTTPLSTPCPKCEEYRDALDFLLEMAGVDPEDTDELDEPGRIALKINSKIERKMYLLRECLAYLRSLPDYCGETECVNTQCTLAERISNHLIAEEK